MKHLLLLCVFFFTTFLYSHSQNALVSYGGFYVAKTKTIADARIDIYTYLRLYNDGTVYLQAVNTYDPKSVSAWFGRYKKFSQKGTYTITGSNISIQLSNKGTEDSKIEGIEETTFNGTIKDATQICMTRNKETENICFSFVTVQDSTTLKYAGYKPELKLPGEWKVKQVLKGSGQVFFTNSDSTIVAIAVLPANKLPFYKEAQTEFETAYAYYEWDSKYMKEEEKMEVTKISDNKDRAFIIWNVKDKDNDNYHLFARNKELLYNIMIYDPKMAVEKKLKIIESLYDLNIN